jgi:hypothetical protein
MALALNTAETTLPCREIPRWGVLGAGFRLESGCSRQIPQQEAASLSVIYAGSAGRAGLLELKLMTLALLDA